MTSRVCFVCGGPYADSALPGLLACLSCGFTTADITLSRQGLESLYSAKYFSGEEYNDYVAERPLIEKQFRLRLLKLLDYVPDPASKRLFEIGAAYGFFLSVARPTFLSSDGIDISRDAAKYARDVLGLRVHAGDFLEYDLDLNQDVVCLWDTIEHLPSPDLYLQKVARSMNRGGVVAITTGDLGSVVARCRGSRWRQIHPPTHLHYFSRATLTRLLQNYGFTVRYSGYEGMYRSLDTIAYIILNIKHSMPGLYRWLRSTGVLKLDVYLNLYDILFVIATKD
jgi:SAM-dependent methyltransferase